MSSGHPKITELHLRRRGIVYLRQSSLQQKRNNLESQRLQYDLVNRARSLGWQTVEVIDVDLGSSAGLGAAERGGFEQLIAAVALGEVGIVLSREASRLSRTDKDWCRLLEVCQVFGTLIGDEHQVYDLDQMDDQLVLGIKGTLSVVELKILKLRMQQGLEAKARRGELRRRLPSGYVYSATGEVVKDPDVRVREAVALVFRKFRELWSARQTYLWLHDQGIELPVHQWTGSRLRVTWKLPTKLFIVGMIRNPFYAGAYCYGRHAREARVEAGRVVKRIGRLRPAEECRVFLPEHHEGYLDWATYADNLRILRRNARATEPDETVAAIRSGKGLLAGVLRCGHCGRRLHVRYWGRAGTSPRYLCAGETQNTGPYCITFAGEPVDRRVSEEILKVISPLGVAASLEALEGAQVRGEDETRQAHRRVEQLEYEARRAFEQYDEVDPRNRLVALELERRWNGKLEDVERARVVLADRERERQVLTDALRARIRELGEHFGAAWNDSRCPVELRKKIIRTVLEEVVIRREGADLQLVLHWKGGAHTAVTLRVLGRRERHRTPAEALEVIQQLTPRYSDEQIAAVLGRLGLRTGKGRRWTTSSVATVRHRYQLPGNGRGEPCTEVFNLKKAAAYCGVSNYTIERLVERGVLKNDQTIPLAPWEIRRADLDAAPVRAILQHLRRTRRLQIEGGVANAQRSLFEETPGESHADNTRYSE